MHLPILVAKWQSHLICAVIHPLFFLEHIQSGGSASSSLTFANIRHHKLLLISDEQ